MNTFSKAVYFIAATWLALWLASHLLGEPLFDDANARQTPYRKVTP